MHASRAVRPLASNRSFADDRALLLDVFTDVVTRAEGERAFGLFERTVALARTARGGDVAAIDELAGLVAELDIGEAEVLVRSLTRWFQLINLVEDNERIRRIRDRELREAPAPRAGSLRDALERLASEGMDADALRTLIERAEVRLVLTAHPTEARRRTTIEKLARVFGVLRDLDERPGIRTADARRRLAPTVQELWASDELRAVSPTVLDEVRASLVWFVTTLAGEVPEVYRDLEEAIASTFGDGEIAVPPLLTFGSWIGGDRDGNPYVTPQVTAEALDVMREHCLRFLQARVELLAGRVSLSERIAGRAPGLEPLLEAGEALFPELAAMLAELNPEEPYRRAFTFIRERVRATLRNDPGGYAEPAQLLADLRLAETSLRQGAGTLTAGGDLHDVIRQVEVFGFHFARLDIREHARRHRETLDEVLGRLGMCDGYADLPDEQRTEVMSRLIADRRPVIPEDLSGFSEDTQTLVGAFRTLHELLHDGHRGAIETYIVSNTEGPADLLEVLLLMKESRLARAGGMDCELRIVPLFEAAETLRAAPATMDTLLGTPVYREALRAMGDEQEVMIGYSDSNKDAGYVASGWTTYRAQERVAEVLRSHGVTWVYFHGRGGSLGRGGGPTNQAILALPAGTVNGRLKMTEQGEVLAAKYAVAEVAHRELELTTSAALVATLRRATPHRAAARRGDGADGRGVRDGVPRARPRRPGPRRVLLRGDAARRGGAAAHRVAPTAPALGRWHRDAARDPVGVLVDAGADHPARLVRAGDRARGCDRPRRARDPARDGAIVAVLLGASRQRRDGAREGRPRDRAPLRRPVGPGGRARAHLERGSPRSSGAPSARCSRCARRSGCSTACPSCRRRSTAATRTSTRCRSCRSSCCGACGQDRTTPTPTRWGA